MAIPGTIFTALRTCGMPQGSTQCLHGSSGSRGNEPWLWALQKCWQHGLLHASSASVFKPGLLIGSWLICTPLTETYWADSSRSCFQNCLKYINIVLIDIKLKKKKSLKSSSDYSSKRALLLLAIFVKQAKYPRKGQVCIWRKCGIGIIGQKEGEERAGISIIHHGTALCWLLKCSQRQLIVVKWLYVLICKIKCPCYVTNSWKFHTTCI